MRRAHIYYHSQVYHQVYHLSGEGKFTVDRYSRVKGLENDELRIKSSLFIFVEMLTVEGNKHLSQKSVPTKNANCSLILGSNS